MSAAGLAWFRFHSRDFLDGVKALGPMERGNYATLLSLIYDEGGRIADDDQWLARQCNCSTRAWRKSREILVALGKLVCRDGFLTNPRADRELEHTATMREARREAGHVGGIRSGKARKKPHNGEDHSSPFSDLTEAHASNMSDRSDPDSKPPPPEPVCEKNPEKSAKKNAILPSDVGENQSLDRSRDSETQKERKKGFPPLSPRGEKPGRKTFLPKDWAPKEAAFDLGDGLGLTRAQVLEAARQMRDKMAHTLERGADWDARFDGWLRGAARLGSHARASPKTRDYAALLRRIEAGDEPSQVECAA